MSDLNLLTIRRLPVLAFANSKQNYRTRISESLLNFVQVEVQKQFPGLKCGRRFSLEYALQTFLKDRGALKKYAADFPEECREDAPSVQAAAKFDTETFSTL